MIALAGGGVMAQIGDTSTISPCREHERANYQRFAECLLYFGQSDFKPLKTIEVAHKYQVARNTAWRWMLIVQNIHGLILDEDGRWQRMQK